MEPLVFSVFFAGNQVYSLWFITIYNSSKFYNNDDVNLLF